MPRTSNQCEHPVESNRLLPNRKGTHTVIVVSGNVMSDEQVCKQYNGYGVCD
jgi:hypothetical protein